MWTPKDEAEIQSVITNGEQTETARFDAKVKVTKDNAEIAKDISAMTVDGGSIIYGIGEDQDKRLTILVPVELAGQIERINSIAQSSISEPPFIDVYSIPTQVDPTKGYIVVNVPPSPRAPHMVTGKKAHKTYGRFYGRNSSGNYTLTEGQVARLYQRREQVDVDLNTVLERELNRYPIQDNAEFIDLYGFVRPVFRTEHFLDNACPEELNTIQFLNQLADQSMNHPITSTKYVPHINPPGRWTPTIDGLAGKMDYSDEMHLRYEVGHDGGGHIYCRGIGRTIQSASDNNLYFFPLVLGGNVAQFLYMFGAMYNQARYYGSVDMGIAVKGLRGCYPHFGKYMILHDYSPYTARDEYRRTTRCTVERLFTDTLAVTKELTMPLIREITKGQFELTAPHQN